MSSEPPPPVAPPLVEHDALPAGTRFGELEIVRVLGVGGFGVVYLARDHALERHVALKEYMPASLARRGVGPLITVRSGSHAQTYAIGLRSFVNEARLLARFDHPSLVKVYRFWEDNATAYMVMPYLQSRTVRDLRRSISQAPSEMWIRHLLGSLLSAMELLHSEGVYHRDIAPDNILLPPEGPPILLDFGAARRVISDRTQTLTAILKPNYAPIEQYAEMTQLRQGPWTDIYALGAVAYFLLFGVPPPPATARAVHDDLVNLPHRLVSGISPRLLGCVAWMLAVRPQHRPQNTRELREVLEGRAPVPVRPPEPEPAPSDMTLPLPGRTDFPPTRRIEPILSAAEAPDDITVIRSAAARPAPNAAPPVASGRGGKGRRQFALAGGLGALALAAAALVWWSRAPERAPVVSTKAMPSAAMASAPAAPPAAALLEPAAPVPQALAEAGSAAPSVVAADAPPSEPTKPSARIARRSVRDAEPKPPARSLESARPAETSAEAPAAAPPPATAEAQTDGPATAREACGKRVFIALWSCLDRECERPRYRDQPECVKVLETKSRRGQ